MRFKSNKYSIYLYNSSKKEISFTIIDITTALMFHDYQNTNESNKAYQKDFSLN